MSPDGLAADEVHAWLIPLTGVVPDAALSAAELLRRDRYRHARHRDAFVARRAVLRSVLGEVLGVPARAIPLAAADGPPRVVGSELGISQSATEGWTLVVVADRRRVGTDLEAGDGSAAAQELEVVLGPVERTWIRAHPAPEQGRAALRCWTLREAMVKATGVGLVLPLEAFDVDPAASGSALLAARWAHGAPERWDLRALAVPHGLVAALAVERRTAALRLVTHGWDGSDRPAPPAA